MRQCMITDVVCSHFGRAFENYERHTGQRHPLQPKVASAGSKRAVANEPLIDESEEQTGKLWHGIVTGLYCLA